jgi:hypothetical protein
LAKRRIFFATDIHGSEACFRKFINAGRFYKADALIFGGDLTGKTIVPVVEDPEGVYTCKFLGETVKVKGERARDELTKKIRSVGSYYQIMSRSESEELSGNQDKVKELFNSLIKESVREWVKLADERLKDTGIGCYITPGNDDDACIDPILNESEYVINPDGKVVDLFEDVEMISLGNSNMTPWKCPRDITEEELSGRIDKLAKDAGNLERSIFNIHVPPYGTGIDSAPELDESLRPRLEPGGEVKMVPAGSTAVREAILRYQPLLGVHGHIHESKGFFKLAQTLCVNPGSEYQEGILKGFLAELSDGEIRDFIFTAG